MEDSQSDPVRTYLTQMGRIPMLSFREEIAAARRIDTTRTRFRRTLLATHYAVQAVAGLVGKVFGGSMRLDRVIGVSVSDPLEKSRVVQRAHRNLETVVGLLERNRRDFATAISKRRPKTMRRQAWRRLVVRCGHASRLLDELRVQHGHLDEPVDINESGGTLRVELNHTDTDVLPSGFRLGDNDSRILAVAANLRAEGHAVTLVSKDLPMRVKAAALGMDAEEYRAELPVDSGWTGMRDIQLTEAEMSALYSAERMRQCEEAGDKLPKR